MTSLRLTFGVGNAARGVSRLTLLAAGRKPSGSARNHQTDVGLTLLSHNAESQRVRTRTACVLSFRRVHCRSRKRILIKQISHTPLPRPPAITHAFFSDTQLTLTFFHPPLAPRLQLISNLLTVVVRCRHNNMTMVGSTIDSVQIPTPLFAMFANDGFDHCSLLW